MRKMRNLFETVAESMAFVTVFALLAGLMFAALFLVCYAVASIIYNVVVAL